MKRTLKTMTVLAATAALSIGSHNSIAGQYQTAPTAFVGISDLDLQVLLDRAGRALTAFRQAWGFPGGAKGRKLLLTTLGAGAIDPIVPRTITAEEATGPFSATIPPDMLGQSRLTGLYHTSLLQKISEEFHSAPALLKRLNPRARFTAGEEIRVPNLPDLARGADVAAEPGSKRIGHHERVRSHFGPVTVVVSRHSAILSVYDKDERVIFHAPVTSGSERDPLPLGHWIIIGVVCKPTYNYNPALFWDADPGNASVTIAAGPNNPVGDVWIDLNKPHYGIHGTPDPARVCYAQSHGCVRLTNWDALELAALVKAGTPVVFEQ